MHTKEFWDVDAQGFKFHSEIARGSFGIVFRAEWRHAPVAIKFLIRSGNEVDDEILKKKRDAEADSLSSVRSKFIVAFLGYGTLNECNDDQMKSLIGHQFIVMEFMEGGSLASHLLRLREENAPLDWEEILTMAHDVACGMDTFPDVPLHSIIISHETCHLRGVTWTCNSLSD